MLTGNQIRKKFLDYFNTKDHAIQKSASLIPQNDPTLYFVNAGMVPFKNLFTGQEQRDYTKATSSQKCMRVSGKHNDLENVGQTRRHHTFFEMLGNFSFGDYFKKEAIAYAWEFLTDVLKIPKEHLWVTVYEDDDEAYNIWLNQEKIPQERLLRLDEKDNFWSMGETGPCGPCSEIHYQFDSAGKVDSKNPTEWFLQKSETGDIMEVWNLVFMQFERHKDGSQTNLPKPSIDTGMGLERLACVLQNVKSNYETDLFTPLLKTIQKLIQKNYGQNPDDDFSMRVLADHIRASTLLISDGVLPSNEGRGYVLRRIMRRAIRHGKKLGQTKPFFHKLVQTLVNEMNEAYPELEQNQSTIEKVILAEEERFLETLDKGLKILNEEISKSQNKILEGKIAFKLYDTFGFPLDLTQILVAENNMTVDEDGFHAEMKKQKERARANWKGTNQEKVSEVYSKLSQTHKTKFLGYENLSSPAKVLAIIQDGKAVTSLTSGAAEIVVDQTPFYAEGGGQVGDKGQITSQNFSANVLDTQKPAGELFVHKIEIQNGTLKTGDSVTMAVENSSRRATMRNHSCTHLMHAALRNVLGDHVRQAGSLVNSKGLRFDFSHFEGISNEDLQKIEKQVNAAILANHPIVYKTMSYDEALEAGALAFFGDKYGSQVRVIQMGDYSVELCGGTHLNHTSEIGAFKIVSESSIAAGVRRIEAITGDAAIAFMQEQAELIQSLSQNLKTAPQNLADRIEKMQEQVKTQDKEIQKLKSELLRGASTNLLENQIEAGNIKAVYHKAKVESAKDLQELAQVILDKLGSGIAVVGAELKGKASLLIMVTKDVAKTHPAQKLLAPLAELIAGRGGGKDQRAQAGGTRLEGLDEVFEKLKTIL